MENTLELSMTEIEFQFDSMDDLAGLGTFDDDSEIIADTEVLDAQLRSGGIEEVDELNIDIAKRSGLPERFGADIEDIDGYFDD